MSKYQFSHIDNNTTVVFAANPRQDVGNTISLPAPILTGAKYKQWGSKNDLPNYRDALLMDNNIMGELMATKRDILLGNGFQAYREVYVEGKKEIQLEAMPADIQEWLDKSDFWNKYLDPAAMQWYKHGNVFPEFIMTKDGNVASIETKDCKYIRAIEKVKGVIPGYIYSIYWGAAAKAEKKNEYFTIQAFTGLDQNSKPKQTKFIYHLWDNVFHDGYYAHPSYWGGMEWIRTSNLIPKFHQANLDNGYSIRFVIKYPEGYFLDKYEFDAATDSNDQTKIQEYLDKERNAKQDFVNKVNALLAGAENAGRALYLEDTFNEVLKEYKGVTIEPIKFEMQDEALIKLFEKSNQANISAQGIHPTLANIETAGKLSSGSEMRNAYLFYILSKTPRPRRMLLKPLDLVFKIHGWDKKYAGLKIGFEDFKITKLDDNKSGTEPVNKSNDGNVQ